MAVPIKKTFEVDFLSAKQIASRNVDNTPASRGAVLQADGKGNSAWLPNTTTATNAFSAVTINSPITDTLYADATTRLGNTLKIVSDGPIRLTGKEYSNQLTIGIDTAAFLTETTKRYPTEDFLSNTVIGSTYEIDCQYKTYFLEFAGHCHLRRQTYPPANYAPCASSSNIIRHLETYLPAIPLAGARHIVFSSQQPHPIVQQPFLEKRTSWN
jgi:hypothetical protein